MRISLALVSLAALVAMLAPHAGAAQRAAALAPAFSAKELTASPTDSWLTNGGNLYNQRYSPLTAINRANVAQLKGVWRTHLRGSGTRRSIGSSAADRLRRRRLRQHRRQRRVRAVDRHRRDPLAVPRESRPGITSVCCGWNNRGVAISEDKVFIGQLDGQLVALDRATGQVAWSIQAERWQDNFSITAAPAVRQRHGHHRVSPAAIAARAAASRRTTRRTAA